MKAIIVLLVFVAIYKTVDAINCNQAALGCNQNCPSSKQLLIQVSPISQQNAACNLLASAPNNCCLLSLSSSYGLGVTYENWCCNNPGPQTVQANIAGVPYIKHSEVGEKRSLEASSDHSEGK